MAKVLRIFKKSLNESNSHWFTSDVINKGVIDSIPVQNTDGKKLPTSIPSPFALIDLVRSAFNKVNNDYDNGIELNSKSDAHRIVSNALDIGQLFFNYDLHSKDLSIESWDVKSDLSALRETGNAEHAHLAKTLELFLTSSDAKSFNFDKLNQFFILRYKGQVIGGTSPKTLFFASFDAVNFDVDISFSKDKMLDPKPLALYLRKDEYYIKHYYTLKKNPNFSNYFPEVSLYLDNNLKEIQKVNFKKANDLQKLDHTHLFKPLTLAENSGVRLNVIEGVNLYKAKPRVIDNSGFFIDSTKEIENPPMVLPVETFSEKIIYAFDEWDINTKVPYNDPRDLKDRTLPSIQEKYPYITLSDFLEDSIIRLPYDLDKTNYITIGDKNKYMLPLKGMFFDYFSVDDIINLDLLEMNERSGEVLEVRLKIPIQNNRFITYCKFYRFTNSVNNNKDDKFGKILDVNFSLGIYPFVKSSHCEINYTVAIAEVNAVKSISNVQSFDSNSNLNTREIGSKNRTTQPNKYSTYLFFEGNLDFLQISIGDTSGVLIPKMKEHINSADIYHFAIDFGTTNTHIEYDCSGNLPKALSFEVPYVGYTYNPESVLRGSVKDQVETAQILLNQELVPNEFGKNLYSLPFRSALLENKNVNYDTSHYLYGDLNIGFDYEKRSILDHLKLETNLKWMQLEDSDNKKRLSKYIQELLELCKNKVLFNDGKYLETKITWLYPTSMSHFQKSSFESIWEDEFSKVFKGVDIANLGTVPESIAPFYYYKNYKGLLAHTKPAVSIDIGGGTTDITIFIGNEPTTISSFKFAGNSIYGDGFNSNINDNGFVNKYYEAFFQKLNANPEFATDEINILETIKLENSSTDVSSFLFSLKDNFNLKSNNVSIDFSGALMNDKDLKLVFLVFYSAIIYHLAQLMKALNKDKPNKILFSGTAAKSMVILDKNLKKANKLFSEIFNKVYESNDADISIQLDESPKIITAKGALKTTFEGDIENLIHTQLGANSGKADDKINFDSIDSKLISEVEFNVNSFLDLVLNLNSEMNYEKSFGISGKSIETLKIVRTEDLKSFIIQGIEEAEEDAGGKMATVEQTLFFFPLIGLLNRLASETIK